jgi:hypothetical protein
MDTTEERLSNQMEVEGMDMVGKQTYGGGYKGVAIESDRGGGYGFGAG